MQMPLTIRRAEAKDADRISQTVLRALRITNAADYPAYVIAAVAENFTPQHILAHMAKRNVFVAIAGADIVGTASLNERVVRSVYVDPDRQRVGVGAELMRAVEALARSQSLDTLSVPSSVTAQGFYQKLGFTFVRDEFHGDERTIIMSKNLIA